MFENYLHDCVKSNECRCTEPKVPFSSFCRECYLALPYDLRIDLWKPWKAGFAEIYTACMDYLEKETNRFTCPKKKITTSSPTSTSSSASAKKKRSGTPSKAVKKKSPKSASALVISLD